MLTSAWQSNMSRAQYGEKFRRVQRYLHSGDCYQVNLAQRFQAQYQGMNGSPLSDSTSQPRPVQCVYPP